MSFQVRLRHRLVRIGIFYAANNKVSCSTLTASRGLQLQKILEVFVNRRLEQR